MIAADPSPARRAAVEAAAGKPVRWTVADPATIRTFIDRTYRADADIERLVKTFELGDDQSKVAAAAAEVSLDEQAPIVQVVNRIVSQALRDRASDIHIEPLDERLRVRFRIDGHLVEVLQPADRRAPALDQPHQDHGRHEHRRAAPPAGRPVLDGDRRQRRRRPRRHAWPRSSARRSSCGSSTRAGR